MKRLQQVTLGLDSVDITSLWQLITRWNIKVKIRRDRISRGYETDRTFTHAAARDVEFYITNLINEAYRMGREDATHESNQS